MASMFRLPQQVSTRYFSCTYSNFYKKNITPAERQILDSYMKGEAQKSKQKQIQQNTPWTQKASQQSQGMVDHYKNVFRKLKFWEKK